MPCDSRDWDDTEEPKKCQRFPSKHQKPTERHGTDSPSQLPEETNSAGVLILELSDCKAITFHCSSHPVCDTSLWQYQETNTWNYHHGQVKAILWLGFSHTQAHRSRNGTIALEQTEGRGESRGEVRIGGWKEVEQNELQLSTM